MATVDLRGLKLLVELASDSNEIIGVPIYQVAALIRRVERLTAACMNECHDVTAHADNCCQICKVLKEDDPSLVMTNGMERLEGQLYTRLTVTRRVSSAEREGQ